jgi:hypothetical protein
MEQVGIGAFCIEHPKSLVQRRLFIPQKDEKAFAEQNEEAANAVAFSNYF